MVLKKALSQKLPPHPIQKYTRHKCNTVLKQLALNPKPPNTWCTLYRRNTNIIKNVYTMCGWAILDRFSWDGILNRLGQRGSKTPHRLECLQRACYRQMLWCLSWTSGILKPVQRLLSEKPAHMLRALFLQSHTKMQVFRGSDWTTEAGSFLSLLDSAQSECSPAPKIFGS